jgi:hypothetical protein
LTQEADKPNVDDLRLCAYRSANYFQVNQPEHLECSHDPRSSLVLCAWEGSKLAATLRVVSTKVPAEAADLLGVVLPGRLQLPATVFSRGAVNADYRGQGWMPFLLTLGVRIAQRTNQACALGVQATGTPHQRAMLEAGWQVRDVAAMSNPCLTMKTTTQFLWLDAKHFETAVAHGLSRASNLLAKIDARTILQVERESVQRLVGRAQESAANVEEQLAANG